MRPEPRRFTLLFAMHSDSPAPAVDGLDAAKLIAGALSPVSSPAFAWDPPPVAEVVLWFPDYEVQALAGRGSMGAVYRAVQRRLQRPVAIKLLPPALATVHYFRPQPALACPIQTSTLS